MRQLIEIEDNGAQYWVIADSAGEAIRLVVDQEDRDSYTEDERPTFIKQCTQQSINGAQYHFSGEDDICSMWFAYMIARDFGSGILACSEWD